ncbi:MAG: sugar ABC transporter substrate-binding protein [Chloroflexi bacterium]|nr:sugar ABC transporter substrate-binding protein [Chloroflexota bacterium]
MKKSLAVFLIVVLVSSFVISNVFANEESPLPGPFKKDVPLKIAYVPVVMNTHYDMVLSGLKEGIDENGGEEFATLNVYAPSSNEKSMEEQFVTLDALLQQDIDVLIFATENEEAFIPYLRKFCEKGVAVFFVNMTELKPENVYYISSVTYDQYDASHKIGEWAVKYFADKDLVNIAVLEGFPGDVNTTRLNGFLDAIAGHDNLKVVSSQVANWTRTDGQSVTENLLISNPEINFIYGLYDEMALGALAAVKQAGRLDDIAIAGYDNTRDAYDSILGGELTATVNTAAKEQGTNLIKAIVAYCLEGEEVEKEINSELIVYDKDTINEFNTDNYIYVPREQIYFWKK